MDVFLLLSGHAPHRYQYITILGTLNAKLLDGFIIT